MEIQNLNGETKIVIEDNVVDDILMDIRDIPEESLIAFDLYKSKYFKIDNNTIYNVNEFTYNKKTDIISFYHNGNYDKISLACRKIDFSEIIAISLVEGSDLFLNIEIEKIPLFVSVGETEFPNFEIRTSGTMYSIDIYLDEYNHMTISWYRSHNNLKDTLRYLSELTEYLFNNPDLLPNIFQNSSIEITINTENGFQQGMNDYELCDEGLNIIIPDGDNVVVDWHRFFKLLIDKTWEVKFIDIENKESV